jgi:hypothetical protein
MINESGKKNPIFIMFMCILQLGFQRFDHSTMQSQSLVMVMVTIYIILVWSCHFADVDRWLFRLISLTTIFQCVWGGRKFYTGQKFRIKNPVFSHYYLRPRKWIHVGLLVEYLCTCVLVYLDVRKNTSVVLFAYFKNKT